MPILATGHIWRRPVAAPRPGVRASARFSFLIARTLPCPQGRACCNREPFRLTYFKHVFEWPSYALFADLHKIKLSGRLSGNRRSREPAWRLRALVCARVLAGQVPDQRVRNLAVIHGREKVYGSIP